MSAFKDIALQIEEKNIAIARIGNAWIDGKITTTQRDEQIASIEQDIRALWDAAS
jgi:hypothetical protein